MPNRGVILRNLVALHQVRVWVVLAVKLGTISNRAVKCQCRHYSILHRLLIDSGENTRHPKTHRADMGIR